MRVSKNMKQFGGCWSCYNPASSSARTPTHSLLHNNQRYCSSFLKGKDKYNTVAVLLSEHTAAKRETHADKHFEWSHTAGSFSPVWFGQSSMKEEVCLRNEGRGREVVYLIMGRKAQRNRQKKQCLNTI